MEGIVGELLPATYVVLQETLAMGYRMDCWGAEKSPQSVTLSYQRIHCTPNYC